MNYSAPKKVRIFTREQSNEHKKWSFETVETFVVNDSVCFIYQEEQTFAEIRKNSVEV